MQVIITRNTKFWQGKTESAYILHTFFDSQDQISQSSETVIKKGLSQSFFTKYFWMFQLDIEVVKNL